ncbi:MAG: glycerol-3-phosphate acyltransferase [Clostridia bacterium]|nr:glycerol-3-phosphate acyltransferase [Clostridia bacterium]
MRYFNFQGYLFQWGAEGKLTLPILLCAMALVGLCGYLLGSVNPAVILSKKLYGKDVRDFGSGNAGMTNMFRCFGKKAGFLTLAGDVLKALLAVLAGYLVLGDRGSYVAGFFCLLGHAFPVFHRFRGGKGVIVSAVTILLIDPLVFLILALIFALMFLATRIVSASSITAAFFLPIVVYGFHRAQPSLTYTAFSLFIALFVIALHR